MALPWALPLSRLMVAKGGFGVSPPVGYSDWNRNILELPDVRCVFFVWL